jgi:hypothetical protein
MTIDRPTTMPPRWADAVLRALLKPSDRDSVSGDLLEEYRDTIVPALGKGANAWYIRQVARFVWRAAWPWAAMIAASLTIRGAIDMLMPAHYTPGVVHPRSFIMTNALLAIWVTCGMWSAWRYGRLRSGVLLAFVAPVLGAVFAVAGAMALLALWHDPQTMAAIRGSGGVDEMWGVPLMLIPVGTIWGTVGAVVGNAAGSFTRRFSSTTLR